MRFLVNIFTFIVIALKFLKVNNEDPDQTSRVAASELSLRCLHMSPKRISGLNRVKYIFAVILFCIKLCFF